MKKKKAKKEDNKIGKRIRRERK
jgi:hypothetical protein